MQVVHRIAEQRYAGLAWHPLRHGQLAEAVHAHCGDHPRGTAVALLPHLCERRGRADGAYHPRQVAVFVSQGMGSGGLRGHARDEETTGRRLHRRAHHQAIAIFDDGPQVPVTGWRSAGGDASGDHGDHVGAEWIRPQERLGLGQELLNSGVNADTHTRVSRS
jgi:hypothetical protein